MRAATPPDRSPLLAAALGFTLHGGSGHPALRTLRGWLDTWNGIGLVAAGMHHQDFDLALTQYDDRGWRATFYTSGLAHSITCTTGSAFEPTPWRAVQHAAWNTLRRERA